MLFVRFCWICFPPPATSQPALDVCYINIHEADWVIQQWLYAIIKPLISTGILFLLKAFWIHTNSFSPTYYMKGGWPLWLLNSIRLPRPLHLQCTLFVTAWPLSIVKSRSIWYYNKRTARECGRHLLVRRWGKRQSERQAARCHQCREMGVKRMKTYKWKSIQESQEGIRTGGKVIE